MILSVAIPSKINFVFGFVFVFSSPMVCAWYALKAGDSQKPCPSAMPQVGTYFGNALLLEHYPTHIMI